ncbi:MAG: DNA alkylation repair protein [Crocinitomicaceae bacterium]|nr:DNA alkylation repair protein [Crocinitomicaceae bacterium]|tara:strand:- start:3302 stop:3988 length:687 start_codon:yes stop_codon:yes gene_type:complete
MRSVEPYFAPLKEVLISNGDQENADSMAAYLKDQFQFYGIKQTPRRTLFNQFVKEYGLPEYANLGQCIRWLYDQPQREYHYCAMELVLKLKRQWDDEVLKHASYLIATNSWWDTVDLIASNIVGAYLKKHPKLVEPTISMWIESENMWLNRTAILYQLKYKEETSTSWLTQSILPHIDSNEFFHQKAIGWALRQYSKFNPQWVIEFADNHDLKPLSRREALRLVVGNN